MYCIVNNRPLWLQTASPLPACPKLATINISVLQFQCGSPREWLGLRVGEWMNCRSLSQVPIQMISNELSFWTKLPNGLDAKLAECHLISSVVRVSCLGIKSNKYSNPINSVPINGSDQIDSNFFRIRLTIQSKSIIQTGSWMICILVIDYTTRSGGINLWGSKVILGHPWHDGDQAAESRVGPWQKLALITQIHLNSIKAKGN